MTNQKGFAAAVLLSVVALLLLVGGAYMLSTKDSVVETDSTLVNEVVEVAEKVMENRDEAEENVAVITDYQYSGSLEDVSGGNATGVANANYDQSGYTLHATFINLPELDEGYFYEGWVVRKSPNDVISTGTANMENGVYLNRFSSNENLTDHNFYVLTLEPDDGNPAPAEHVLEGTLTEN